MLKVFMAVLIAIVGYFCFWPVAIEPVAWTAPVSAGYQGVFAQNTKLANVESLSLNGQHGPEDMVIDAAGNIYASAHGGWVLKKSAQEDDFKPWVETKGRALGMDFDAAGNLIVADAYRGLLSIDPSGEIKVLSDKVGDSPILYADDVDIAPNGKMYFSDASVRFGAQDNGGTYPASLLDVMEHSRSGRVLEYDPASGQTRTIMDGLSFANGIAMDPLGRFVLVNETSEYRIHKYWLQGDKAGTSEIIVDNLPGFPDNIVTGQNGRYWFGLVSPRLPIIDNLADKPWLRKVIQRMPAFVRPAATSYGHVVAMDENGKILLSLQNPEGTYPVTTGVLETDDYLYITSLMANSAARMPKPASLLAPQ